MLAYIPYMDPMGYKYNNGLEIRHTKKYFRWFQQLSGRGQVMGYGHTSSHWVPQELDG